MSETTAVQPFAASGSGKSPEEIAFELVSKLKGQGVWGERNRSEILDMYAECLDAVKGLRSYDGQNRVYAPIAGLAAAPASVAAAPAHTPPPAEPAAPAPTVAEAAPVAAEPVQPEPVQAAPEPAQPQAAPPAPEPVQSAPEPAPEPAPAPSPAPAPQVQTPQVRVQQQSLQDAVDKVYSQG